MLRLGVYLLAALSTIVTAAEPRFIDLSLIVAPEYPCTWPGPDWPMFQINHYLKIGPLSPYNSDIVVIDLNTGTQLDAPPHSIPRPSTKLPNAGPPGDMFTEKIPAWQFGGEACVIDVRESLDKAANGRSPLVTKQQIERWEARNRTLRFGDVALLFSGYSDKYYRSLPAGRRFLADPVGGIAPGWPDPDPEAMEYIATRGVRAAGTDSPSMGPIPDLADATHVAGLKHGMIWTESATNLSSLPPTGAFYCMLGPKHVGDLASEARAFAVVGDPLARTLIESARARRAVDLTIPLSPALPLVWPGQGAGNHRQPYMRVPFFYMPQLDLSQSTHMMDTHTGTHLVPPSYALPPRGFDNRTYAPEVRKWLAEYETKYGMRGFSDITVDKVPISQTSGWARVIDVRGKQEITTQDIGTFEKTKGDLKPRDIVIFRSDYSELCMRPTPEGKACMSAPLNGKAKGWPALNPETIAFLAGKGIQCIGTDGPTIGGVDPKNALMTYWALGTRGMVAVEYLVNVGNVPERAYFLFACPKIRDAHGGPGRAVTFF
jgi:kynurenine formamidase